MITIARSMGPRFKQSRRFGVSIFGHPKELKRGPKKDGRRKESEYGKQLNEKQKLKLYYGISEKQMVNYMKKAKQKSQNSDMILGDIVITTLERRLDNLVYRLGFARSLRQARQMVVHGHIAVNGQKTDIPSYICAVGDEISIREQAKDFEIVKANLEATSFVVPYLSLDRDNLKGTLSTYPERTAVPIEVTDSLVVEFYSQKG